MVWGTWTCRHVKGTPKTQTLGAAWDNYVNYWLAKLAKANPRGSNSMGRPPSISLARLHLWKISHPLQSDFFHELIINRKYAASGVNYFETLLQMLQKRVYLKGKKAAESEPWSVCLFRGCRPPQERGAQLDVAWHRLVTCRIAVWVSKTDQTRTVKIILRVKRIIRELQLSQSAEQERIFAHISDRKFYRVFIEMRHALGFSEDLQFVVHMLRCTRLLGARLISAVRCSGWDTHHLRWPNAMHTLSRQHWTLLLMLWTTQLHSQCQKISN